jgi:hypothetical protein
MDTPRRMAAPSSQTLTSRGVRALRGLPSSTKLAMVCVIFGWFFTNTLVVTLGSLEHGVRFFDMSAVIADPMRLFFGVETPLQRTLFGLICLAAVLAPLAPHLSKGAGAWLCYLAPFVLLMVCGVALYSRTSGEFFASPAEAKSVAGSLIHLANDLARRGTGLVSRHIAVGGGAYLALIGSLVLVVQGMRGFRAARAPGPYAP